MWSAEIGAPESRRAWRDAGRARAGDGSMRRALVTRASSSPLGPITPPSVESSITRRSAKCRCLVAALLAMLSRLGRAQVPAQNRRVGIDSPVAEERPIAARLFDETRIALGDEDGRLRIRLGKDAAERIADEGMAEEFQSIRARLRLEAHAIRRGDVHAVRDRMRTLNRSPCFDLRRTELGLLGGVPPDRRRVEQHLGAEQARYARGLGIPLIPADQHADVCITSMPHAKPAGLLGDLANAINAVIVRGVAGGEVVLLVEQRIVRDVHLAIDTEE